MAEDNDDKTEDPSGRKLEEARDQGNLGRSQDFTSGVVLLTAVACVSIFGAEFTERSKAMMREMFGSIANVPVPTERWFTFLGTHVIKEMMDMVWPMLLTLLISGLLVNFLQVGFNFTTKPFEFDLKKIFSVSALTNMFGKQAFMELLKGLAKMAAVGWVAYDSIMSRFTDLLQSTDLDLTGIVRLILDISFDMLWKVVLLLLLIGIVDWIYQKRKNWNDLKMTKQESKDEAKNANGDPQTIGARRKAMLKMRQRFMMKDVPKATVVITNPTFIAIAIRYIRGEDEVPVVIAKGKRLIAQKIRDLASEHEIPVVENKALARGMYDHVQPGEAVPNEFFTGVAEILAYVLTMDKNKVASK